MSASSGIAQYTLLTLLAAERANATHVRIKPAGTAAVIELWRGHDVGWQESDLTDRTQPFHLHVMRQLATMMSAEMPAQGQLVTGRIQLVRGDDRPPLYVLAAIDHDLTVAAYLELVDAAAFESGRPPQSPMPS